MQQQKTANYQSTTKTRQQSKPLDVLTSRLGNMICSHAQLSFVGNSLHFFLENGPCHHVTLLSHCLLWWGTADAEIKAPLPLP